MKLTDVVTFLAVLCKAVPHFFGLNIVSAAKSA